MSGEEATCDAEGACSFHGVDLACYLVGVCRGAVCSNHFIPFIQKEREKLLLAKTSPVHASGQATSPFQLGNEAIALRGLPRGSEAVRPGQGDT